MDSPQENNQTKELTGKWERLPVRRLTLWTLIVLITTISVTYRVIYLTEAWRTSALFVLTPAIMAIVFVGLAPKSNSATRFSIFATTLTLLISMIILPEAIICWLLLLPIFFAVVLVVSLAIEHTRKSKKLRVFLLPLALLGFEGAGVGDLVDPNNSVQASTFVNYDEHTLLDKLATAPVFESDLSFFLSLGFPKPIDSSGTGIELGDRRTITFDGGPAGSSSEMVFEIVETGDNYIEYSLVSDTTLIGRWLTIEKSLVSWETTKANQLEVTWKISYRRTLNPGWYFDPLQQLGMGQAVEYLLLETVN